MTDQEAMLLGAEQALRTEGGTPTGVQLCIDVLRELVTPTVAPTGKPLYEAIRDGYNEDACRAAGLWPTRKGEAASDYFTWLMNTDAGRQHWADGLDAMGLPGAAETVRALGVEAEAARA